MITYLASIGHECRATEITRERGAKHVTQHKNLAWSVSDGIHLDRFEPAGFYDVVVSDQVIEHLHPDDVVDHFEGVKNILKNGGRYIFAMPHKFFGPWDVSRVFRKSKPSGMHLREYTIYETVNMLRVAGYSQISLTCELRRVAMLGMSDIAWVSMLERLLIFILKLLRDRFCQHQSLFPIQYIHMVATK